MLKWKPRKEGTPWRVAPEDWWRYFWGFYFLVRVFYPRPRLLTYSLRPAEYYTHLRLWRLVRKMLALKKNSMMDIGA